METLSSSSSLTTTFQFPKQSKATARHPQLHHPFSNNHHPSSAASSSSLSSTLHQKDTFTPRLNSFHHPSSSSSSTTTFLPPQPQPQPSHERVVHRKAAVGYAAALLEVSQCEGSVYRVERDARRLLKLLKNGHLREFMMDEEHEKGQVVKQLLDKGKFDKNFVALVKLVVDKANNNNKNNNKVVGLVKDVLLQFLNIFSHLSAAATTNNIPKLA